MGLVLWVYVTTKNGMQLVKITFLPPSPPCFMRILFVIIVREKKVASQLVQPEPVSKLSRRSHQVISQEEEEDEQEEENEEEEEEEEDEDSEQDERAPSRRVLEIDTSNLKDDDDSGGGDSGSDSDGS